MSEPKKKMDKMTKGFLIFISTAFLILTFIVILGDHSYELKGAAKASTTHQEQNQASKGSASPEFQPYLEEMHRQISGKWQPPAVNKDSEVILRFTIKKNGYVVDEQIAQSSGDKAVDESALEALRKASPLPPLPLSFPKDSVTVNFNFTVRANEY